MKTSFAFETHADQFFIDTEQTFRNSSIFTLFLSLFLFFLLIFIIFHISEIFSGKIISKKATEWVLNFDHIRQTLGYRKMLLLDHNFGIFTIAKHHPFMVNFIVFIGQPCFFSTLNETHLQRRFMVINGRSCHIISPEVAKKHHSLMVNYQPSSFSFTGLPKTKVSIKLKRL